MIMNIGIFRLSFNWNENSFFSFYGIFVIIHVLSIVSAVTISNNNEDSDQTTSSSITEQQDDQIFAAESSHHDIYGKCC